MPPTHTQALTAIEGQEFLASKLTDKQLDYLLLLRERDGAPSFIEFRTKGIWKLRFRRWGGTLRLPGGIDLEILPKTAATSDLQILRRQVTQMLAAADEVTIPSEELVRIGSSQTVCDSFLEWLRYETVRHLRIGWPNDYIRVKEKSPVMRGRLCTAELQRQWPPRPDQLTIEHDVFTPENPLLDTVRLGLERAVKMARGESTATRLSNLSLRLGPATRTVRDLARPTVIARRNIHWAPAYGAYRRLMFGDALMPFVARTHDGPQLMFDMEVVFEKLAWRWLKEELLGWNVQLKGEQKNLIVAPEKLAAQRPDIIATNDHGLRLIADAKWKSVSEASQLDSDDIRQLVVYCSMWDAPIGLLILPSATDDVSISWSKTDVLLPRHIGMIHIPISKRASSPVDLTASLSKFAG